MQFNLAELKPAVLVIDMQSVFVAADGPFHNTAMDAVIGRINAFLGAIRARDLPVLFCNYVLRADGSDAGLLRAAPWRQHMMEDAAGIGVDARLERLAGDGELRHSRPGAFHGTPLEQWLREKGRDAVILTGVSVNNAISTTAREAFARDIPAIVVRDCVAAAPFEPGEFMGAYLDALHTWTAEVAGAGDVLARIAAGAARGAQ